MAKARKERAKGKPNILPSRARGTEQKVDGKVKVVAEHTKERATGKAEARQQRAKGKQSIRRLLAFDGRSQAFALCTSSALQ